MMCRYCAQSGTKKDENGYCIKYACEQRKKQDEEHRRAAAFKAIPLTSRIRTVTTEEVYRYGELTETIVRYR